MMKTAAVSPQQQSASPASVSKIEDFLRSDQKPRVIALKERASSWCSPSLLKKRSVLHMLPDDALITIGEHVGRLCGAPTYVKLAQTCKRMKRLLLPEQDPSLMDIGDEEDAAENNSVIRNVIRARVMCFINSCSLPLPPLLNVPKDWSTQIKTLEQLALFELWYSHPFSRDNRIKFDFASSTVDEEYREDIVNLVEIMNRFPSMSLQLDAHCGIAAPLPIAMPFSQHRGECVVAFICGDHGEHMDPSRISMIPWGKRIARRVARSDHLFGAHAREGKGWVEVFFQLGGESEGDTLVLPSPPAYYSIDDADDDNSDDESDSARGWMYWNEESDSDGSIY
jgi:outer membrane protein OmpA-like peptidoglycan-associated protein